MLDVGADFCVWKIMIRIRDAGFKLLARRIRHVTLALAQNVIWPAELLKQGKETHSRFMCNSNETKHEITKDNLSTLIQKQEKYC